MGHLQGRGHIGGRPAQRGAKNEHGALAGRQTLDGGDERQFDRLSADGGGFRCVVVRRHAIEKDVGVGLQPGHVGAGDGRHRPALAAPGEVDACVCGDAVEPGPDVATGLQVVPVPPRFEEGLLDKVLSVGKRTEHPVAVDVELSAVTL